MDEILQLIKLHGPALLFGFCLLEASGVPIPASLALLAAGAAAAQHVADWRALALAGFLGLLVGDLLLYVVGRFTGWWLLGLLCRLSANPESCILSSADRFYRQGRVTLVLSKFVPGLSALAAPLAGSMRMGLVEFLLLDAAGAALYTSVYLTLGYLAGDVVKAALPVVSAAGRVIEVVAGLGVVGFLGWRYWQAQFGVMGSRALRQILKATVSDVAESTGGVVFDVRSHGYYEPDAQRIKGATRLEPNRLHTAMTEVPAGTKVFLYCTCYREATSLRVAQHLRQQGFDPYVIEGGLRQWRKAGLPLEPVPPEDIILLPDFGRHQPRKP